MLRRRTPAADLAAIEKLNQEDIEATLAQDPKRLIDGWAEDAVAFFPGPAVGKQAIWKVYSQSPRMKVLSYTSIYKNLQVEGGLGLACEWYEKKAEYQLSLGSPPISWHANGLLVLKRQSDGAWKAVMGFPIS